MEDGVGIEMEGELSNAEGDMLEEQFSMMSGGDALSNMAESIGDS